MNLTNSNRSFKTAAEKAYEIICEKILSGEFPPGERLTRRAMATLTGVSTIPVIEALHRLENEGLVESQPHFGAQVISMDEATIRDRFILRMAVECQVARILAIHRTEQQVNRLLLLAKELDETPRTPNDEELCWSRHYHFHLRMAEFTGCKSLVQSLTRLGLFDILRRSINTYVNRYGVIGPKQHHEKLVTSIATGDPDEAERKMREHIHYSGILNETSL